MPKKCLPPLSRHAVLAESSICASEILRVPGPASLSNYSPKSVEDWHAITSAFVCVSKYLVFIPTQPTGQSYYIGAMGV
jgi:hypothetical protein